MKLLYQGRQLFQLKQLPKKIKKQEEQKKNSIKEKQIELAKTGLENSIEVIDQIASKKYPEIAFNAVSFLLDVIGIIIESQPKLFKNKKAQSKAIMAINELSKLFGLAKKAFSDKGRENTSWQSVTFDGLTEPFKVNIKKRFKLTSAIFGLFVLLGKIQAYTDIYHITVSTLLRLFIVIYLFLVAANEGQLLVKIFGESIATIDLKLRDYLLVNAYLLYDEIFESQEKKHPKPKTKPKVHYQPPKYSFPKEVKKLKAQTTCKCYYKLFHRWMLR